MKVETAKNEGYNSLKLLIFLNLFDGIVTYIGLHFGFYVELNKMLNMIFNISKTIFILIKIIIPTIVLIVLLMNISTSISKLTKMVIYFGNSVYSILCIYHIVLIIKLIA